VIWGAGRLLTLRRERIERVTIADRNIESAQKLAQTLAGKKEILIEEGGLYGPEA